MEDIEKMIALIRHWIEHNEGHLSHYEKWAEKAADLGLASTMAALRDAIDEFSQANQHLRRALETLPFDRKDS